MDEKQPKTVFVTGPRNPDIDSLASSFALAELRRRQNPDCRFLQHTCRFVYETQM